MRTGSGRVGREHCPIDHGDWRAGHRHRGRGQRADQTDERSWITYWHPLRGPTGEIVGVNVAAEEITDRKRAEAELRASERLFHTLADSIPQLVWMAEAGGKVFWFNNHWHEYTGTPAGETDSNDWQAILAQPRCMKPAIVGRKRWGPERHWRWSYRCAGKTESIVHF